MSLKYTHMKSCSDGVTNKVSGVNNSGMILSRRQLRFVTAVGAVLMVGIFLTALNVYELHRLTQEHWTKDHSHVITAKSGGAYAEGQGESFYSHPIAWVRGAHKQTGYLTHVNNVFTRMGYDLGELTDSEAESSNWDVLWSHNYPFKEIKSLMLKLKPHQRVNHFPGSGFVSNKVNLATSGLASIPKAFRMPSEKEKLLAHAKAHPETMFVQKSNNHRGIKIEKIDALDLGADGSFIQEFIHNPLLIDGYKFDIGVYTILSSVDPLRVYIFEGDVLFRFCSEKYHPFDVAVRDKYVVGDDYLPTWKVPSLRPYYVDQGHGMKSSFDAWLTDNDKSPDVVWDGVKEAIRDVFYSKERSLTKASNAYQSTHNFFEMMRFDFIVDDKLKVHLMEANMSPNLSSAHFKQNRLLYEQVIFNVLSLVGVGRAIHSGSLKATSDDEKAMQVAIKDIVVFPQHCQTNCGQKESCSKDECQLCYTCVSSSQIAVFSQSYLEHVNRRECRRVIPEAVTPEQSHQAIDMDKLSAQNTLMTEWFRGKCLLDKSFCS